MMLSRLDGQGILVTKSLKIASQEYAKETTNELNSALTKTIWNHINANAEKDHLTSEEAQRIFDKMFRELQPQLFVAYKREETKVIREQKASTSGAVTSPHE